MNDPAYQCGVFFLNHTHFDAPRLGTNRRDRARHAPPGRSEQVFVSFSPRSRAHHMQDLASQLAVSKVDKKAIFPAT
jgi:hypothetical protein